jgi:hypothetical protein
MVAIHDDFAPRIERPELTLQVVQRNKESARKVADFPLPWLSHLDELAIRRQQ